MPLTFDPDWLINSGSAAIGPSGFIFSISGWGGGPGGQEIVWFLLLENFGLAPVEMDLARQSAPGPVTEPLGFLQIDDFMFTAGAHLFVIHGTRMDNLSSIACRIRGESIHRWCYAASARFPAGTYVEKASEALTGTAEVVTAGRARVHAAAAIKSDTALPTDYPTIAADPAFSIQSASVGTPPATVGDPSQFQLTAAAHEGSNVFTVTADEELVWFYALGAGGGRQWWTGVMGSSGG